MSEQNNQPFDSKTYLSNLTESPGIYQMFDAEGSVLYVGKAKNLKKRVASYFRARGLNNKTISLVRRIARIDVTVTATETEALLLEHNMIKQNRPPYNVLLRDDKSYPYIFLSDAKYPALSLHRGAKRGKGRYFGPYPNAVSVRESLNLLQQVFKVRQCDDPYFSNRSRPCLQYQIKRCTAPCMAYVSEEAYQQQVKYTVLFLEGKNDQVLKELASKMEAASKRLDFERAAEYRDQLQHLKRVTEQQFIETGNDQTDVVAMAVKAGMICIHTLFIRSGRMIGSRSYYPSMGLETDETSLMLGFLGQFYIANKQREIPKRIVVPFEAPAFMSLAKAFGQMAGHKVDVVGPTRGRVESWLDLAMNTAKENLAARVANKESILKRFTVLEQVLQSDRPINRLECFDISHSSGESTVASCVVFDRNGPLKSDYRRYDIEGITAGDDYAAMYQVLKRRYEAIVEGDKKKPDILLIDGGKGQTSQAQKVLTALAITDIIVIGVVKGPGRRPGFDQLLLCDEEKTLHVRDDSSALHLIQHIRDEAHRFAVKGHTQKRDKKRRQSGLENIPGIGAKRRKNLLHHFGSVKAVREAPVRELMKVPMISKKIAEDIYAEFHNH